jgi:hypothetical protein
MELLFHRQPNGLSKNEMAELANRAINCATQDEVKELVHHISKSNPKPNNNGIAVSSPAISPHIPVHLPSL